MIYEIFGWLGMFLLVFSYALLSTNKIDNHSTIYHILNFIGAFGIILNAYHNKASPIVVLNIAWAFIAIYNLYINRRKT